MGNRKNVEWLAVNALESFMQSFVSNDFLLLVVSYLLF